MSTLITISQSILYSFTTRFTWVESMMAKRRNNGILKSIKIYEEEKKQGKLKKLNSIDELFEE